MPDPIFRYLRPQLCVRRCPAQLGLSGPASYFHIAAPPSSLARQFQHNSQNCPSNDGFCLDCIICKCICVSLIPRVPWLRAELSAWEKAAITAEPGNKPLVAKTLGHWKADGNLAGVRTPPPSPSSPSPSGPRGSRSGMRSMRCSPRSRSRSPARTSRLAFRSVE